MVTRTVRLTQDKAALYTPFEIFRVHNQFALLTALTMIPFPYPQITHLVGCHLVAILTQFMFRPSINQVSTKCYMDWYEHVKFVVLILYFVIIKVKLLIELFQYSSTKDLIKDDKESSRKNRRDNFPTLPLIC